MRDVRMAEPLDLVVVGASAGGVEALREFAGGLPPDLPRRCWSCCTCRPGA